MSNYFKDKAIKDLDFFFGKDNWEKISNKYYTIDNSVIDDDNILLRTTNIVTYYKNNERKTLLLVGANKAVYLKDWQLKAVQEYPAGNSYFVKLNRKYFKIYTFKSNFKGFEFEFEHDCDFDDLKEEARSQVKQQFRLGHNDFYGD